MLGWVVAVALPCLLLCFWNGLWLWGMPWGCCCGWELG